MHKYLKKQEKLHKLKQRQHSQQLAQNQPLKTIRNAYERGQNLSQQTVVKLIDQAGQPSEKQKIVYEMLMFRKVKIVEKLVKSKNIDKAQIIDSNQEVKLLYDSLAIDIGKKKESEKQTDENRKKGQEILTGQMNNKDRIIYAIKKKTSMLKKIDPKYYVLVIGLILAAILVKKHRAKIIAVLKVILNV